MTTELLALAPAILREHQAAVADALSALEHARRCGELLQEAKQHCAHGTWLPWLQAHCPAISERTAQRYMRLAERWPELEAKATRVSDLPIRDALALLAEPSAGTDDAASVGAWPPFAGALNCLCDEAEADELTLARLHDRLDTMEPARRKAERLDQLRELGEMIRALSDLKGRAWQRRIRAERALGLLLAEATANGWNWPQYVLSMGDEAFSTFLDLCENRLAELESA